MRPLWQEVTRERQDAPLTCWMRSARPHKELGRCWLLLEVRAGGIAAVCCCCSSFWLALTAAPSVVPAPGRLPDQEVAKRSTRSAAERWAARKARRGVGDAGVAATGMPPELARGAAALSVAEDSDSEETSYSARVGACVCVHTLSLALRSSPHTTPNPRATHAQTNYCPPKALLLQMCMLTLRPCTASSNASSGTLTQHAMACSHPLLTLPSHSMCTPGGGT